MAMASWLRRKGRRDQARHGLEYMVQQASRHEGTMAWLLASYDLEVVCAELRCDIATACRCLLTPQPPMGAFRTIARRLAQQYGIDESGLARLVGGAEAARYGLPRTAARGEAPELTPALAAR